MTPCQACTKREQEIAAAKVRGFRASEVFAVTSYSREDRGHKLYYSSQGTVTLCTARKLEPHRFNH